MFQRSVSKIPSRLSCASFSCSNFARCLCHSSCKRSYVAGFRSSSGRKRRADFSDGPADADSGGALPATAAFELVASPSGAAAALTPETATVAPVAAINSLLLIIFLPPFWSHTELSWGTLLAHFGRRGKQGVRTAIGQDVLRKQTLEDC